jgi:hypothetical protein
LGGRGQGQLKVDDEGFRVESLHGNEENITGTPVQGIILAAMSAMGRYLASADRLLPADQGQSPRFNESVRQGGARTFRKL